MKTKAPYYLFLVSRISGAISFVLTVIFGLSAIMGMIGGDDVGNLPTYAIISASVFISSVVVGSLILDL